MKSEKKLLEICCFSLFSCLEAQYGGANRIELCGGMPEGGTTPSIGLVKECLSKINIPIYVMIRPRGGDFFYSKTELDVMLADIKEMKKLKPAGFVFGLLNQSGEIDLENTTKLISASKPYPVTFHRAFDRCVNPILALDQLITLGVENVLTSGQRNTALEGIKNLEKYIINAAGKINVMAGSGVNPDNISQLANVGIKNFHFTAKKPFNSPMKYINEKMENNTEYENLKFEADINLIKKAVEIIKMLQ